jgi:hypothetical protein
MTFRRKLARYCATLVTLAAVHVTPLAAQDGNEPGDPMAAMMAAWASYAAVGPPHEALAERAGDWDATVKFWSAAGAPAQVSQGRSTGTSIMGGRYLLERFTSTSPEGSAFEGMGLMGYDNLREQFVAMWVDSMSTSILTAQSVEYNDDFSRIEYRGESPDLPSGEYRMQRSVEYWHDACIFRPMLNTHSVRT